VFVLGCQLWLAFITLVLKYHAFVQVEGIKVKVKILDSIFFKKVLVSQHIWKIHLSLVPQCVFQSMGISVEYSCRSAWHIDALFLLVSKTVGGDASLFIGCGWFCIVESYLIRSSRRLRFTSFILLACWLKQRFRRLLPNNDLFWISKLVAIVFLLTLGKIFCSLRVSTVLRWKKMRNVHKLLFVKILRRTHHSCLLIIQKVWLNLLHIYQIRTSCGVSYSSTSTRTSKSSNLKITYFYILRPESVADLRPELILLIAF